ncbi:MAG: nucleotidyl transferase AbiEii/AbiGii toxin family protein [Acidimicrobiia bacterium]|nr:nucleotidyl transferase AbiEii/AbiGii toxin family protein [Acidimicrobiia bacterium]
MAQRSQAQIIEIFHLLFLRVLVAGDADWCTLKGGANLRYFFGSPRYSNDVDLDFHGKASWTVAKRVGALLDGGTQMALLARQAKIELAEVSATKQTDTTLRWKIGLRVTGHDELIRTKVEFSGRDDQSDDVAFAPIPNDVVKPYGLLSPTVRHYLPTAATNQKITALATRRETKARDVFDLDLLLRQRHADGSGLTGLDPTRAAVAAERALSIPFASFVSEVAPFIEADLAALYDASQWDMMCVAVAGDLEILAAGTPPNGGTT